MMLLLLTGPGISAQAQSGLQDSYDTLMEQGYEAVIQGDLSTALIHFTRAEAIQPGDSLATVAIQNTQAQLDRLLHHQDTFNPFIPLATDRPNAVVPGGRRSHRWCGTAEASLVGLMPKSGEILTVVAQPSVLIYVPELPESTDLLVVADEQRYSFSHDGKAGLIEVALPATLQEGDHYQWGIELVCQPDPARNPILQGEIYRIKSPSLTQQLTPTLSLDTRSRLFHIQGLSHDQLMLLARSQRETASFQPEWNQLLQLLELEHLANVPVLDCCVD